jgi:hypothetical protein
MPHLLQLDDQRIFIGELPDFLLGMDELAIDFDIEDSAAAGDEAQVLDAGTESVEQSGRQTDGLGCVISHHAEGDFHVHAVLLLVVHRTEVCTVDIAAVVVKGTGRTSIAQQRRPISPFFVLRAIVVRLGRCHVTRSQF